jgi:hypothetical protein
MAALMNALADAKIGLTSSKEQIADLQKVIAQLTAFAERTIQSIGGMYLETNKDEKIIDGAFCSRCHDADNRFVRILTTLARSTRGMGICPQCKADYKLYQVEDVLSRLRDREGSMGGASGSIED